MNVFVLKAALGLDTSEYEEGLDKAGKKASVFSDVLKANLVTKGIEVAAKGMMKLGQAAVSVVQQSVDAFANYEQLVGGVETLFKGSADVVKQYAQDAYINAGLSANEYMETVTSFSASLIQSLGGNTAKAAEMANMAIEDMADNANKMGSDMASIQNAYAGFAKQNYTMLDNLKLGYGGTKAEMDRLIKDAMKLDKTFKVSTKTTKKGKKANKELAYSYADIVQAIHIVQNEMGITGTTAKEASETIEGSFKRMKAAWQNLLSGLGEGSDEKVDMLVEQLVESAEVYLNNMLPVVEKILYGLVTVIEGLAPVIADRLPAFIERILPSLTKATATLVTAFTKALIANLPTIIKCAQEIIGAIFDAVQEEYPAAIPVAATVGGVFVASKVTKIGSGLGDILVKLGLIKTGAGVAGKAVAAAAGNAAAGAEAAAAAAAGAETAVAGAGAAAAEAGAAAAGATAGTGALAASISGVTVAAGAAVGGLAAVAGVGWLANREYEKAAKAEEEEINTALETYRKLYAEKSPQIADEWARTVYGITTTSHYHLSIEKEIARKIEKNWTDVPKNLWDGLKLEWDKYFGKNGSGIAGLLNDAIVAPIGNLISKVGGWGGDLIRSFVNGIVSAWNSAKGAVESILNWIKARIHFSEPDKGPLSDFHTYAPDMMKLFADGILQNRGLITNAVDRAFNIAPNMAGAITGGQTFSVSRGTPAQQPTQINLILDNTVIGRALLPYINAEQSRMGVQLVGGAL